MKNQFKVVTWTQDVTKYSEPVKVEGEWGEVLPLPLEGTTTFKVELSTVDLNNVNAIVGSVYITLDRLTEHTGEAKIEIEAKLAELGLLDPPQPTDLEKAKQLRWNRLLSIRDGLESKGFNYLGKTFDGDQRSILRILATAQAATAAALAGQDFDVDWTTADNSIVTMTRDQVLGLPAALATRVNEIHMQARELRLALDSAGSVEQVQGVKWPGVEYEVVEPYNPFDENGDLPSVS